MQIKILSHQLFKFKYFCAQVTKLKTVLILRVSENKMSKISVDFQELIFHAYLVAYLGKTIKIKELDITMQG